jgi:hypothetical protein
MAAQKSAHHLQRHGKICSGTDQWMWSILVGPKSS